MPSSQLDAVAMDTSLALHQLVKAQVDVRWSSSSFRMNFVPDTPIHTHLLVDIGFCCPIYLRQQAKTTRSSPCVSPSHKQGELPFRIALHGREMAGGNDVFRVTN